MAVGQRSSYTQTVAIDRVRGDLGLRSASFLTDAEIVLWLLEAQRLVAYQTHWARKQGTAINVVSGTNLYELPVDAIAIEEAYHDTLRLAPVTVPELRWWNGTSNPFTVSGTPTNYFLQGMTAIGLYPNPDTSLTGGLILHYAYLPPAPTSGADFFYVPTALDKSLLTYAKLQASRKDANGEGRFRIPYLEAEWAQDLRDLNQLVGDVNEQELLVIGAGNDAGDWDWSWPSVVVPAP
jgi:hypothetical protein